MFGLRSISAGAITEKNDRFASSNRLNSRCSARTLTEQSPSKIVVNLCTPRIYSRTNSRRSDEEPLYYAAPNFLGLRAPLYRLVPPSGLVWELEKRRPVAAPDRG